MELLLESHSGLGFNLGVAGASLSLMEMRNVSPGMRSLRNWACPRSASYVLNELGEVYLSVFVLVVLVPQEVQCAIAQDSTVAGKQFSEFRDLDGTATVLVILIEVVLEFLRRQVRYVCRHFFRY